MGEVRAWVVATVQGCLVVFGLCTVLEAVVPPQRTKESAVINGVRFGKGSRTWLSTDVNPRVVVVEEKGDMVRVVFPSGAEVYVHEDYDTVLDALALQENDILGMPLKKPVKKK